MHEDGGLHPHRRQVFGEGPRGSIARQVGSEDSLVNVPETRYTKTADGVHIAFQVVGDGPLDFVYVGPWITHLEYRWELPQYASYLRRIASFSRLILFDKRGMGMSDPVPIDQLPDLETRMDDLRAVMDEVGSERAVIYGASESGALALLFAATYPERTTALVIHGSYPSGAWSPDAPWGYTTEDIETDTEWIERSWGTEEYVRSFPVCRGRRGVRPLVRFLSATRHESGRSYRRNTDGLRDGRPSCPVRDPRSYFDPAPGRG